MKDRIRKFYNDNKEVALAVGAVAAATVVGMILVRKTGKGFAPTHADYYKREDGASLIVVGMENGRSRPFYYDPNVEAS